MPTDQTTDPEDHDLFANDSLVDRVEDYCEGYRELQRIGATRKAQKELLELLRKEALTLLKGNDGREADWTEEQIAPISPPRGPGEEIMVTDGLGGESKVFVVPRASQGRRVPYPKTLIARRKRYHVSAKDLARRMEISEAQISLWENGHKDPRIDQVEQASHAINALRKKQ